MPNNYKEMNNKIMKGFRKSIRNLIKEKALRDESMVLSENGKIIKVKARDLL